jgi:hypothetical protein
VFQFKRPTVLSNDYVFRILGLSTKIYNEKNPLRLFSPSLATWDQGYVRDEARLILLLKAEHHFAGGMFNAFDNMNGKSVVKHQQAERDVAEATQ